MMIWIWVKVFSLPLFSEILNGFNTVKWFLLCQIKLLKLFSDIAHAFHLIFIMPWAFSWKKPLRPLISADISSGVSEHSVCSYLLFIVTYITVLLQTLKQKAGAGWNVSDVNSFSQHHSVFTDAVKVCKGKCLASFQLRSFH